MKERPILMSGPMARAIMEGRKTQTRRVVKPQPVPVGPNRWRYRNIAPNDGTHLIDLCPYGQPGDLLWVRETWAEYMGHPVYRADGDRSFNDGRGLLAIGPWRPSIYMPRWASRLTLRITDVRVERVQEISEEDAQAEGVEENSFTTLFTCAFRQLWDSLNAKRGYSWESNPRVWVIEFERHEQGAKP